MLDFSTGLSIWEIYGDIIFTKLIILFLFVFIIRLFINIFK